MRKYIIAGLIGIAALTTVFAFTMNSETKKGCPCTPDCQPDDAWCTCPTDCRH